MSPVEIMALAGAVPSSPSAGEAADASAFQGALAQQAPATPPRGRLSIARALNQHAQAASHVATPPAQPGLLASTVAEMAVEAGSDAPPADKTGAPTDCVVAPPTDLLAETDLVAQPDATVAAEAPPLVLPTEVEIVATAEGGGKVADPLAPIVAPEIQTPLTVPAEDALASGAVVTAEQIVATGPDIQPLETPTTPPVETPDLTLPTPAVETASDTAATPAGPTASDDAPVVENGRQADVAKVETTKVEAPVADDAAPSSPAGGREAAPQAAQGQAHAPIQRADAPLAQRLSFDAVTQLSAQILRRLEGRSTRFEMELNPLDLGRVDVRLDIDDQGQLAARLAFDNPVAGADLRSRVDELRRQLEDAGFQLAQDAFSFAEREGSRDQSQDQGGRRRLMVQGLQLAEAADLASQPSLRASMRAGVDVRI